MRDDLDEEARRAHRRAARSGGERKSQGGGGAASASPRAEIVAKGRAPNSSPSPSTRSRRFTSSASSRILAPCGVARIEEIDFVAACGRPSGGPSRASRAARSAPKMRHSQRGVAFARCRVRGPPALSMRSDAGARSEPSRRHALGGDNGGSPTAPPTIRSRYGARRHRRGCALRSDRKAKSGDTLVECECGRGRDRPESGRCRRRPLRVT